MKKQPMATLIVENEPLQAQALKLFLEDLYGPSVTVVEDTVEALRALEDGAQFDCIIMELTSHMLDWTGAVRLLRNRDFDNPIIGYSLLGHEEHVEKAAHVGMDAIVLKGDFKKLNKVVDNLTRR